jgi:hypothetical protein
MTDGHDPIAYAYSCANHFQVLGVAELWDRAATQLAPRDPGAARIALDHAINAYKAYRKAYASHMPASRWDHDYGPELSDAQRRRREIPACDPRPDLPGWILLVLRREYTQAIQELGEGPLTADERAVLAAMVLLCRIARQDETADRLEARARE